MSSQIRTILAGELRQLACDLAMQAPGLAEGSEDAASSCLGLCERLGQVAGMIEAPALEEVAMFLMSNIPALLGNTTDCHAPAEMCTELEQCLCEGVESNRWSALASHLTAARWPASMDPMAAEQVALALQSLAVEVEPPAPVLPTFTLDELTLRPPDDVGAETLRAFFLEAPAQSTQLSRLFDRWEGSITADDIAAAQRLAHTLKGSSALCGLQAITQLTHALEALLQRLTPEQPISRRTRHQLIEASDMIEQLVELASAAGSSPDALPAMIHQLYGGIDSEDPVEPLAEREPTPQDPPVFATVEPTLDVPTALIDESLRRAGEINLAISQINAHVTGTLERANRLMQQLTLVQQRVYELETMIDTRATPALRVQPTSDDSDFDPLELDQYTALHSLSRAFAESSLDSRELSRDLTDELLKLQNLLAQHARLGRELTDSVMSTRLVPVASIAPRLERIVRQAARQTGREVELDITGRELCIDTDILNGLVEPLMHALRNAVDHGIEPPEERLAAGKPPRGRIQLSFRREGNRIEVMCRDDGRGLDYPAIERRGRERGLLSINAKTTPSELAALIFTPGFSTRDEATAISGRGVGMDVVRASIELLKGTTHLESGAGCTLTFRLPLSLTSAHALFVSVGAAVYGLPGTTVDQVLYSDAGRVLQLGGQYAFEHGGDVMPLHSLGALVGQHTDALANIEHQPRPLVIVHGETGRIALLVERALDSRQVVIKGLSSMLPTLPGVAGACVLPDGGVGIVLEIRELLREPSVTSPVVQTSDSKRTVQVAQRALVVDDSLSARRAVKQLLSDCGYEVTVASDGLDALAKIEHWTPDVVLVDLEMPRMNGLELTSHLRATPAMRSLPIVMITSRGAEKHRAQALRAGVTDFVTKPFLEHDLLDRLQALVPP